MTAVAPTPTVLLDDGTGAYPYDVSSRASLTSMTTSGHGRTDEFSQAGATSLTVTLKNDDGAFTAGIANLQVNGSFESAFTTGGVVGSATRFSFDAATFLSGARSVKVAPLGGDTGNLGFQADRVAATPGVAYVGSIYAKRAAGAGTIRVDIQFLNAALASLGSASTVTDLTTTNAPVGSWVRALSTGTAPALTAWVRIRVFYTSYVGGTDVANFDLAQLEVGTVPSFFIAPGQGIRCKLTLGATTVTAFTGRISELPLGWNGGVAKSSSITLTAVDPLANLALRPLRSMLEQEILLDSPSAYYTLGEAEGSTAAGDTSGNQSPALAIAGTGAAVVFGSGTGPTDGLPAVTFAGGQYLSTAVTGLSMTGSWSALALYSTTSAPGVGSRAEIVNVHFGTGATSNDIAMGVNNAGRFSFAGPVSGAGQSASTVTDGLSHCAIVTFDGTNLRLYDDGVLDATVAALSAPFAATSVSVGGAPFTSGTEVPFTGVISHVAIFDGVTLSPTQVASISAVLSGTETTAARFTRIAGYVGATVSTPSNSGQLMGAQATSGASVLDALQAVATAEGGVMFANGSGTLVMQGRYYRAFQTTPVLTVPMKDVSDSTTITYDTQQLINQVTVTRTGGATQVVTNQPSIDTYGLISEGLDLAVADDASALYRAQWDASKHGTPTPRMGSMTVNLLTSSQAAAIMQAEIGDRWSLSGLPGQTWSGFGDLTIEGWSETLSITATGAEWSRTFNLLPWLLAEAFILDDATYGVLDSAVPIGY